MPYKDPLGQLNWQRKNRNEVRTYNRSYYAKNLAKMRESGRVRMRQWRKDNPEKRREIDRRSRAKHPDVYKHRDFVKNMKLYGLTPADYTLMLEKQNGLCAICKNPPSGKKRLGVDHCHNTKIVRALLCDRCNQGIGMFSDDVEMMQKAITYLLEHRNDS